LIGVSKICIGDLVSIVYGAFLVYIVLITKLTANALYTRY